MFKGIIINAELPPILTTLRSFDQCRDIIGGYIQYAPLDRGDVILMIDEDGKSKGLPFNERADNWWARNLTGRLPGDRIVGTAILVGVDADGEYIDVPDTVAATFRLTMTGGRR